MRERERERARAREREITHTDISSPECILVGTNEITRFRDTSLATAAGVKYTDPDLMKVSLCTSTMPNASLCATKKIDEIN